MTIFSFLIDSANSADPDQTALREESSLFSISIFHRCFLKLGLLPFILSVNSNF